MVSSTHCFASSSEINEQRPPKQRLQQPPRCPHTRGSCPDPVWEVNHGPIPINPMRRCTLRECVVDLARYETSCSAPGWSGEQEPQRARETAPEPNHARRDEQACGNDAVDAIDAKNTSIAHNAIYVEAPPSEATQPNAALLFAACIESVGRVTTSRRWCSYVEDGSARADGENKRRPNRCQDAAVCLVIAS